MENRREFHLNNKPVGAYDSAWLPNLSCLALDIVLRMGVVLVSAPGLAGRPAPRVLTTQTANRTPHVVLGSLAHIRISHLTNLRRGSAYNPARRSANSGLGSGMQRRQTAVDGTLRWKGM